MPRAADDDAELPLTVAAAPDEDVRPMNPVLRAIVGKVEGMRNSQRMAGCIARARAANADLDDRDVWKLGAVFFLSGMLPPIALGAPASSAGSPLPT